MKFKLIFAWYDLWIGAFWDKAKRYLYVFPVPCVGVRIEIPLPMHTKCPDCGGMTTLQSGKGSDQGYTFDYGNRYECTDCVWAGAWINPKDVPPSQRMSTPTRHDKNKER